MTRLPPLADVEAAVCAFHPGPGPDFHFPTPAPQTSAQRLADVERRFLDLAIEHFAGGYGDMASLARAVIVQRAQVRMEAADV